MGTDALGLSADPDAFFRFYMVVSSPLGRV